MHLVKRCLAAAVLLAAIIALCVYIKEHNPLSQAARNHTITFRGEEYTFLSAEGKLCYLGELVFEGSESNSPEDLEYSYLGFQPGIYSIKGDEDHSIFIRYVYDNEWYAIYRKSSLPPLDLSVDNCSRLELVPEYSINAAHAACGEGITDRVQIAAFLADVRSQQSPEEAGLFDLIPPENGIRYVHINQVIYGFFEEEPNVALRMEVSSYNDQAYSVRIEGREYVLPEKWLEMFGIQ